MAAQLVTTLIARTVLFAVALFLANLPACQQDDWLNEETARITLDGETFELEIAADDASREQGLSGRESIDEDGGMLFVFPNAQVRRFWMKDCLVDIDIIYLDGRGYITAMHRMKAEPPRRDGESETAYENRLPLYSSVLPAQFAIELRAGWLDELDLEVDQRVDLDTDRLKRLAR